MFVALSRFVVRNNMDDDVRAAFQERPHLVDSAPGFIRMEVLSPQERPEEFWLMTWWEDEASFDSWHKSHAYKDAHAGMPRGLKLVPGEQRIYRLERVAQ